ncbi:MAG: YafY family transcriptional regulator [Anaerolineales bacterium]|nr:YafY family transcriptional regulator [Anaerolineales bacterium]
MSTTATRLITLIMLLQRQPRQTANDLAEKLGVSVRTLHRYMLMLDEMGIPVYSERGRYGGFSLVRGYKMPPLIFTPEEATAICLGAGLVSEMWEGLYDEASEGAVAKIENVLPDEQRDEVAWARRILVTTQLKRPGLQPYAPFLNTLRKAIRLQKRVRITYQGASQNEPLQREFDAYALAFRQGWWYVIGYCHLRQDMRSFRIDRIHQILQLDESYQIPPEFDPQKYLAFEIQSQAQVHVRLHLAPEVAAFALSTPAAWEKIEPQADGSVIVAASLPDIYWAASMTMSFGPGATVLEPDELRQLVYEWAQAVAGLYEA